MLFGEHVETCVCESVSRIRETHPDIPFETLFQGDISVDKSYYDYQWSGHQTVARPLKRQTKALRMNNPDKTNRPQKVRAI